MILSECRKLYKINGLVSLTNKWHGKGRNVSNCYRFKRIRSSISYVIRELEILKTMRYHYIPIRMTKLQCMMLIIGKTGVGQAANIGTVYDFYSSFLFI